MCRLANSVRALGRGDPCRLDIAKNAKRGGFSISGTLTFLATVPAKPLRAGQRRVILYLQYINTFP